MATTSPARAARDNVSNAFRKLLLATTHRLRGAQLRTQSHRSHRPALLSPCNGSCQVLSALQGQWRPSRQTSVTCAPASQSNKDTQHRMQHTQFNHWVHVCIRRYVGVHWSVAGPRNEQERGGTIAKLMWSGGCPVAALCRSPRATATAHSTLLFHRPTQKQYGARRAVESVREVRKSTPRQHHHECTGVAGRKMQVIRPSKTCWKQLFC